MAGLLKIVRNAFLLVCGFLSCIIVPLALPDLGLPSTITGFLGALYPTVIVLAGLKWWYSGEKEVIKPMPLMVSKGLMTKVIEPDGTVKVYAHERFTGTKQDLKDFAEEEL